MNIFMNNQKSFDFSTLGIAVIKTEAAAVLKLASRLGEKFNSACELLLSCKGRVIVIGMGKSGHIGRKIAATLASTGTPAFFVHPAEASHGDLGMLTNQDVIIILSNSGTTEEIVTILPIIKRLGIPFISLTGNPNAILATSADIHLDVSIEKEACPLNLAPTASTTATLAMGDALAIALLQARGFTEEDFALSHPNGRLGKRLLLRVSDIMHSGEALPKIHEDALLKDTLVEMSLKSLGMTAILNHNGEHIGLFTDGDVRRTLDKGYDIHTTPIKQVMTKKYTTVKSNMLAAEALTLMERRKINGLLVVDDNNQLIGAFNLLDVVRSGVI